MMLFQETSRGWENVLLPERGYHFRGPLDLQVAAITPSSALPWEAEMLCTQAADDHAALLRDVSCAEECTLTCAGV